MEKNSTRDKTSRVGWVKRSERYFSQSFGDIQKFNFVVEAFFVCGYKVLG